MFISFEGLDFCGKSTQVSLLKKFLEENNKSVFLIREPGGTEISEKIRDLLLDKKNMEMKAKTELLLFYSSRSQLLHEVIRPKLEEGVFVLSDRFHDSSTAYQGFGRGLGLEFIKSLNKFVLEETVPDLTFFIDVSLSEIEKRKRLNTGTKLDRIESSDNEFYKKVREGYLTLAETEKRFQLIDGNRSVKDIFSDILASVQNHPKFRG